MHIILIAFFFLAPVLTFAADPDAKAESQNFQPWAFELDLSTCEVKPKDPMIAKLPRFGSTGLNTNTTSSTSFSTSLKKHCSGPFDSGSEKKETITHPPCLDPCNCCSCNKLHDEIRTCIFKADINGNEGLYADARQYLLLLEEKMKTPNIFFPLRLKSRVLCYRRIIDCGIDKHFRTDQDEYDLARESPQLVKSLHNKAVKKDEELFNVIEDILNISGSIFAKKAHTEMGSLEQLEGIIRLIQEFRTERTNGGIRFQAGNKLNEFAKVVQEARYSDQPNSLAGKKEDKKETKEN